ncbi:hypothetical protein CES85_4945 [Ochrobactrum quorumnocens]|uniref:Uncharacterized protein n=1 Tax=Ochrobactrum quorumnocens TaxID=271865 RepID=A0A248UBI2_9HYPH|nr:hypothetical protein CES85_4945 [[Ochrobactrum] quorumnocens]
MSLAKSQVPHLVLPQQTAFAFHWRREPKQAATQALASLRQNTFIMIKMAAAP